MARIRVLLVLGVVMLTVLACAAMAQARSPESLMMHKVNHFRRSHGLRGVRTSRSLRHSAKEYARHMLHSNYFGHAARIHASHRFRRLGEILEYQRGTRPNVREAFYCWLHSPSHRAIILDRSFTYAGAGRVAGRFQGGRNTIWVMHFGRP